MDIVYTYVNANCENWKSKRKLAKEMYYDPDVNNIDSNIEDRFLDNDELLLSLRSVDKFLPWINNIYIVTDEHIPEWLNINHEKIRIVDHKEIIPNEYLPTFNSHVIELFLHKIPNLSSTFIYLNDDVIFTNEIKKEELMDNKIYVFLDKCYTKKGIPNVNEYGFRSAWKNANKWLDENFIIEKRCKMSHAPIIIQKYILEEILDLMKDEIDVICEQKFRSIKDYNILCSIYIYYCLYNNFAKINKKLKCISIFQNDDITKIMNRECDILCLNNYSKDVFEYVKNNILYEKSEFEI